jgi:alpha-mannosidase
MRALVYPQRWRPQLFVSGPVGYLPPSDAEALEYHPAELGMALGPPWATFWFRIKSSVPQGCDGQRVDLLWETGSESTLWLGNRALQGLNTSNVYPRPDAVLVEHATANEPLAFMVETACSGAKGQRDRPPTGVTLRRCELARFDPDAWKLWLDFSTLQELEQALDADRLDPAWSGYLLHQLNEACNVWDPDDRSRWARASELLAELYECHNGTVAHDIVAVGNAHIDTAWLWPLSETYRKCVRTFSTQTRLMDRYPDYRFACPQAQHYAWIKERNPVLYSEIAARVRGGQWIPVGGVWTEPDCNLPSGEALVRQFLVGQRFFEAEFGSRCSEGWLPDSFGFNGQLPQILRGVGIAYFLTTKLADSPFNKPAHHTFVWKGIDGSEVLAHFPPVDTFDAEASVHELCRSVRNFKDHPRTRSSLVPFGHGDGGGGPTAQMIETLERVGDLQAVPRTSIGTAADFFVRTESRPEELPRIDGELYYELHQGTYTSQAQAKRANRRGEQLLHDTEFLCTVTDRLGLATYPVEQLTEAWRMQLINAFHDILPGTSIAEVHEEAARGYLQIIETCERLCAHALAALSPQRGLPAPVNTTSFERLEVIEDRGGKPVLASCPPYGVGQITRAAEDDVRLNESRELVLENGQLRVVLTRGGDVASIIEKRTGLEALAELGNRLELYADRPVAEEAWNVDPFHLETRRLCPPAKSYEVVHRDPLRAEVAFVRPIGKRSRLRQTIRLDAYSSRLEFHNVVEWYEDHALLKVAFPTVVHASRASYEMQFGAVDRPTHASTLHDLARYEVPGHRFADLSEPGFGVSVLTDCKYGYSAEGGTLRVSLLRGPRAPDPGADIGTHQFAYALVPHARDWQDAQIVAQAVNFNAPLLWTEASIKAHCFARVEGSLVLDTIKRAEDGVGFIVRLYEPHGRGGSARLTLGLPAEFATACNLLEDPIGDPIPLEAGAIDLSHRPFEILTVKMT